MSKRGLSADEKAAKLLGWFHTTREFYSLKEIEKAGSKYTGIPGIAIKDVLQTLIDENQVNQEKVGTSNYYWSYPGAGAAKLQAEHATAQTTVSELEAKCNQAQETLHKLKMDRGLCEGQDQSDRQELLETFYAKQKELEDIKNQLAQYSEGDPQVYEQKKKDIQAMKDSALRWTDQISSLLSYARNTLNAETEPLRQMLDLPEDYEDLTF